MGFRIGLLYSRFASMPQALWAALRADGHDIIRPEDLRIRTPMSAEDMAHFARLAAPDVIFCPFLKEVVPPEVCERTTIVGSHFWWRILIRDGEHLANSSQIMRRPRIPVT